MLCIGIDPGTQGAICLLDPLQKRMRFLDTPNAKNLQESSREIMSWFQKGCLPHIPVAIEDVHSMGNMSAKSNFQFGRNLGFVEILATLFQDTIVYIPPKKWQKGCGISFTYPDKATDTEKSKIRKATVATRIKELYPKAKIYGPRGGLKDGRADALMIAHYLSLTLENKHESDQTKT